MTIIHSFKGSSWKKHKYLYKKNGRYVYDSDSEEWLDSETGKEISKKEQYKIETSQEIVNKGREFCKKVSNTIVPDVVKNGPTIRDVIDYFSGKDSWFTDHK